MTKTRITRHLRSVLYGSAAIGLPLLTLAANPHRHRGRVEAPQNLTPDTLGLAVQVPGPSAPPPHLWDAVSRQLWQSGDVPERILCVLAGAIIGGLLGAFFSDRFRRWRRRIGLAIVAVTLIAAALADNALAFGVGFGISALVIYRLLKDKLNFLDEAIYGNAHPATHAEIAAAGHAPAYDPATGSYSHSEPGIPLGTVI